MSNFVIEKNVPIPAVIPRGNPTAGGSRYVKLLRRMAPGDSVIVANLNLNSLYGACARNHWRVRIQKQKGVERTWRVWRVQ